MRRYIFPVLLGLVGIAILLSLGFWQVRRLAWKEALLADINARIGGSPVQIATLTAPDPARDQYQPVSVEGRTTGQELLVLSGKKGQGAGFEVIDAFETPEGRRVLLDRGFIPEDMRDTARPAIRVTGTGNLLWPNDSDSYTPPPDAKTGLWFARDVAGMAKTLGTEPLLIVLKASEGDLQGVGPRPVDTSAIPNDHLNYAITWFSLALVWAGMTGFLLWRIRQRQI
ncbi:surfeit locus 1 family protein [Defluviimonas denitrificans]|jgi:surfeit locus 1 family protein|uniref:SURF1-like protein n=1 Tax=Albidovulum denitrificans TaxID=404881 RepID=A0A2S8S9H3_9RHOB|nr:SURF1 family protein [Defluviimonas denitrificans]PQV57399.1 surfeit locus 1 family protein [Defluviimonas denitrificans]